MMAGAKVLCLFWWALFLQGKVLLGAGREQGRAGTGKMLPDKLLGKLISNPKYRDHVKPVKGLL